MTKILIVDDDIIAGSRLFFAVQEMITIDKETRYANSPQKGLKAIAEFQPDLVILNIEMRSMTGFDFLNQCSNRIFDVIFTASSAAFAIEAIRYRPLDYLLKPIDKTELKNAISLHINKRELDVRSPDPTSVEENNYKLALSTCDGVFFYDPKKIIRLKAENNYTRFYFTDEKPLLVARTLKNYEEILLGHNFIRPHKSHMVNKKFVRFLDKGEFLQLADGSHISVSRRKKSELVKELSGN
jgi:two-component system LytT family response regulator